MYNHHSKFLLVCGIIGLLLLPCQGSGQVYETDIHPQLAEKFKSVTYYIWFPDKNQPVDGIILHQHGCGEGASEAGRTTAYDLQWQALARKWNYALMGSCYKHVNECFDWSDPNNGTHRAFLHGLEKLGQKTNHPELETVPWVLWGHSGGGYWVYNMSLIHPHKVQVMVLQSPGRMKPSDVGLHIPTLCILGIEESYDRFYQLWSDAVRTMKYRINKLAPSCLAVDPASSHDCHFARSLSIPFIDECLTRIHNNQKIECDSKDGCIYGSLRNFELTTDPKGKHGLVYFTWLPTKEFGLQWQEFVKSGQVSDASAPDTAPFDLVVKNSENGIELSWKAYADMKSGIRFFVIYRNNEIIGYCPAADHDKTTDTFTDWNYSDTPERPFPEMKYVDKAVDNDNTYVYQISMVNGAGLESDKSEEQNITRK